MVTAFCEREWCRHCVMGTTLPRLAFAKQVPLLSAWDKQETRSKQGTRPPLLLSLAIRINVKIFYTSGTQYNLYIGVNMTKVFWYQWCFLCYHNAGHTTHFTHNTMNKQSWKCLIKNTTSIYIICIVIQLYNINHAAANNAAFNVTANSKKKNPKICRQFHANV